MNCPNCKTEMEKGFFTDGFWGSGEKTTIASFTKFVGRKTEYVFAWRCPKCGKIELISELKN